VENHLDDAHLIWRLVSGVGHGACCHQENEREDAMDDWVCFLHGF
jgi:hypothetical protein